MVDKVQIQNQFHFPMYRTPLFSSNPISCHQVPYYDEFRAVNNQNQKWYASPEQTNENSAPCGADGTKLLSNSKGKLPTKLETNINEVQEILWTGCFCRSKNCLEDLNAENVYRHRLDISKLNKAEHHIFLIGTLSTCLNDPKTTSQRNCIKYTYRGRRVCKEAFLYLQYCTVQQLKDTQDYLLNFGVGPMMSMMSPNQTSARRTMYYNEVYEPLKQFLSKYIEENVGKENITTGQNIVFPLGTTKKSLHQTYKAYIKQHIPGGKWASYSTFITFLRRHFPHLVFYKFGWKITSPAVRYKKEDTERNINSTSHLSHSAWFENESFAQPELLVPLTITEVLENSDPASSFSSDETFIRI